MVDAPSLSATVLLDKHRVENRLTSLEITLSLNSLALRAASVGKWMHLLLCESPLLEHFKAPEVDLPLHLLYVTKALSTKPSFSSREGDDFLVPPVPRQVWGCRRLKTLHIRVDESFNSGISDLEEQIRVFYGYISRVCPYLEDLAIKRFHSLPQQNFAVNMCLLSRLKRLRTLQLVGILHLREQDIDWIKQTYYYSTKEQMKLELGWELQKDQRPSFAKSLVKQ
ncbi:hypothetical protein BCR41DRAFT_348134 [Lobosporangium transversale]|uniref:Uncharacterized protein n=1 Tax=Lobosporangium transversale TaxID=64571 RepID=A0A1Y2GVQ0_9FUNG|nr:hypothetical protein BCR41DRAFT_348134 [Lobosporangium transversale]ORZ26339.1 hypothetical protein BCR41DRAFT_348134 [Lobosporangium transversale]|eukprot:XP_021884104.1 hypothetical protein BCR41DRAFT_348134 [Lobosporangium transversale]